MPSLQSSRTTPIYFNLPHHILMFCCSNERKGKKKSEKVEMCHKETRGKAFLPLKMHLFTSVDLNAGGCKALLS